MTNLEYNNELKQKYTHFSRDLNEKFINIHPIQRGGILTKEAYKALVAYGDGYSLCDNCLKGRIDKIENPPVADFLNDMAKFLNIDNIMPTAAARESKKIAMEVLSNKYPNRKTVIVDSLAHYTTYLAIETNNLKVKEVTNSGYPEYDLNLEQYRDIIKEVLEEEDELPLLVVLTHVDYKYGNYNNPELVGKICNEFDIPFLLNTAYSSGILPIDCKQSDVDFIACSGHKSMSASGPIGLLGFKKEFFDDVMVHSKIQGNITNKSFPNKICTFNGCPPVYGAPLITLMASFPEIVRRTQNKYVQEESEKANYVIEKIQEIPDIQVLGKLPKIHPLTNVETKAFNKVADSHPRRGFFLRDEFKERGIIGMLPGISTEIKFNTYGLSWSQVEHFADSILDIAKKYNII
ncbi:MAG: O-phospho-L-seryl-tRNA:Cys-tRNA synthase [Candidatus Lokiarchaeota archaeon]|nr:O-phospho-L-seryl-tRNA:Cys-tRNA synthase [Candidatus Lokiarchaeota archaeon]MBD3199623.1 O-phospho-L-seryl-tRNA:Cys-tRNA synthase [Candidatus Lokiarchaeota archaeon]